MIWVVIYVAGFVVSCGVLKALDNCNDNIDVAAMSLVWPLIAPIQGVKHITIGVIQYNSERKRLQEEREREQRKLLREAGLE